MSEDAKAEGGLPLLNWKSEALLLAWIPVASYFIAFSFELGYCEHFGVPLSFITVDTLTIFNCFIYLLMFTGFVVVAQRGLTSQSHPKARAVLLQYGTLIGIAFGMLFMADQGQESAFILMGTAILFVSDLFNALENKAMSKESFVMRLEGIACLTHRQNHYIPSKLESFLFGIAGISLFLLIVSYSIGSGIATQRIDFLVSAKDPTLIFMDVKDGKAICAKIDPATNKVLRQVVIMPMPETENTVFSVKRTGRLNF